MSWERLWRLPGKRLDTLAIRQAAASVAAAYEGVAVEVEWEEDDEVTCFFSVPRGGTPGNGAPHPSEPWEVEVSIYDLGQDGVVLSLEGEAADNDAAFDDACQLAEDLADALDAEPIEV